MVGGAREQEQWNGGGRKAREVQERRSANAMKGGAREQGCKIERRKEVAR